MRARLFFTVLNEGRQQFRTRHTVTMLDLCHVAAIPLGAKNFKMATDLFAGRLPARESKPGLPMDDARTVAVVASMFRAAAPFMIGGPRVRQ
jgi:hypothetical protein